MKTNEDYIEESFPDIISMPTRSFDLKLIKQEALKKLNNEY